MSDGRASAVAQDATARETRYASQPHATASKTTDRTSPALRSRIVDLSFGDTTVSVVSEPHQRTTRHLAIDTVAATARTYAASSYVPELRNTASDGGVLVAIGKVKEFVPRVVAAIATTEITLMYPSG